MHVSSTDLFSGGIFLVYVAIEKNRSEQKKLPNGLTQRKNNLSEKR